MHPITELYDALSKYNSFVVDGRICTNGCKSALISTRPAWKTDAITFKYGNFVRAAETEQQGGDYRKLLGITDSTDKVYAAYLSRLYKLYKERIQF